MMMVVVDASPGRRALKGLAFQYLRLTHRLSWSTLNVHQTAPSTTQFTPHLAITTVLDTQNTTPPSQVLHANNTMVCRPLLSRNHMPRARSDFVGWLVGSSLPLNEQRPRQRRHNKTTFPFASLCVTTSYTLRKHTPACLRTSQPRFFSFQTHSESQDSNG